LGVTFNSQAPVTLTDAANKTAGSSDPELLRIMGLRSGAGIEVFVVDNDIAHQGGAATGNLGTANAKTVISDRGTSNTLLAHELGHVLGLNHPGTGTPTDGEANTIMQPTGSHSAANPTRNTMTNFSRISFPAPGGPICLRPDA
jgi:hypothetical protein